MKRLVPALLLAAVACCALAVPALAAPSVTGTFPVPGIETNSKIVAGPDGNMWATVQSGENDVARITPAGAVQEFEIADLQQVQGIAVGPEGRLWVTGNNKVASFSPSDPKGSASPAKIGAIAGASPIVAGPEGQMWVATLNTILHFEPANPAGAVEKTVAELTPNDIDVAGSLIAVGDGGQPRIVTSTAGLDIKEIPVGKEGKVMGLAGGPGGQIAFFEPTGDSRAGGLADAAKSSADPGVGRRPVRRRLRL